MAKTVVIAGAGFAGLSTAHKLLLYTAPKVTEGLKVILVSPNSHFYWNIAAPRGVLPDGTPDNELFIPIGPAFAKYPPANFEFVLGKAEMIEREGNSIHIVCNDGPPRDIVYDHLVIATGSSLRSGLPFKIVGTHEATIQALDSLRSEIKAAKSIFIAGAGSTGVETAGELAEAYGNTKQITLLASGGTVLHTAGLFPSVVQQVEKDLKKLGVKLVHGLKVQTAERKPGDGGTTLTLSNGETISTDCYLPLHGIQLNTSWIPREMLDASGNVLLDKYMRVEGATNIWGIGDIGNHEVKQANMLDSQIIRLAETLDFILTGQEAKIKEFKPLGSVKIFFTVGKRHGSGQMWSLKVWSWAVVYIKGRRMLIDAAQDYVAGKRLKDAPM
ncbi:hypothetical protein DRE_06721 [Drechslerella stenobrocha 248]|uniref:FAD/NAD(P)-binding domain-containing protein n=1 Tax=Drechslerella stenobrocha 248 TaxID=1043628 RepID=W7HN59_9PEZI|nr:hypothetical protein DRE_06721 [Drechslerella stenobrocha 248]